jgi:nucleotide-binding universal stress UspA family protein
MKILVGHDGSKHASKALEEAIRLADKFGGEIVVLSVVPDLCLSSEEISVNECNLVSNTMRAEMTQRMSKVGEEAARKGVKVELVVKEGRPADVIVDTAESIGAGLIVVGSKGRHKVKRLFLGSISSAVASEAKCNVLIIK